MNESGLKQDLFGWRCVIPTCLNKRLIEYRVVASGRKSNAWVEIPIMVGAERKHHEESKSVLFVVLDTLVDDRSRIICVAEDDVELLQPADVLPLEDISSGVEEAIRHLESTWAARLIDYGSYLHLRDAIYAIKKRRKRW